MFLNDVLIAVAIDDLMFLLVLVMFHVKLHGVNVMSIHGMIVFNCRFRLITVKSIDRIRCLGFMIVFILLCELVGRDY